MGRLLEDAKRASVDRDRRVQTEQDRMARCLPEKSHPFPKTLGQTLKQLTSISRSVEGADLRDNKTVVLEERKAAREAGVAATGANG